MTLNWGNVVRPSGFEPENCGAESSDVQRTVVVRMSWSEGVVCPPMSVAVRSHLVLWLQKWLQIEELNEMGRLEVELRSGTVTTFDFDSQGPSDSEVQ